MSRSLVVLEDSEESVTKLLQTGIETVHDLVRRAARPAGRKQVATAAGLSEETVYLLAKQADLLRIDGTDSASAQLLVNSGIRTVADLSRCDPKKLLKRIGSLETTSEAAITLNMLNAWRDIARELKPVLQPSKSDPAPETIGATQTEPREAMFVEMTEMVTNLGRGIALAQQEMDEQAIRTQKLINSDQRLRTMGLTASWFTIPEATLNIKMNYSLVREEGAEHDSPAGSLRFKVAPLNARTQNYFKLTEGMQSELNLRFVSLPPPEHVTSPIIVPAVIGASLDNAKQTLTDAGLRAGTITTVPGDPNGENKAEVADQVPAAGADARFQDRVNLFVRRSTQ